MLTNTVKVTLQIRRDLAINWIKQNPILASGEYGLEIDTRLVKLGDGTTPWNNLPYQNKIDSRYFKTLNNGALTFSDEFLNIVTGGHSIELNGVMRYRGIATSPITNGGTEDPEIENYNFGTEGIYAIEGDVVLYNRKEFVWSGTQWELFGDEENYALKDSTNDIDTITEWDPGSAPTLGDTINANEITDWDSGAASHAVVESGTLKLTNSTPPTLIYVVKQIPNVTDTGSVPSLTVTPTTVIVP